MEIDQHAAGTAAPPPVRIIPIPDATSAGYWEAAANHVLTVARCAVCGQTTLPPDMSCPHCHTTEPGFTFVPVEGKARVRTWTVIRRPFLQGFTPPFMLVDVELNDHPHIRMVAGLLDGAEAKLEIGTPVVVAFEDIAPKISVPAFRLEKSA